MIRTLRTIILVYAVCFVCFLAYSLFTFPSGTLMDVYLRSYLLSNATILLIENLIPVTASALLIRFSLSRTKHGSTASAGVSALTRDWSFSRLITYIFLPLVIAAVGFTVVLEVAYPRLRRTQTTQEFVSRLSRGALVEGARALERHEFENALRYFGVYMETDSSNDSVAELQREAKRRIAVEAAVEAAGAGIPPKESDPPPDVERAFSEKKAAYSSLLGGDFLEAYAGFLKLRDSLKEDQDIAVYLAESKESLSTVAFFFDEIEAIAASAGTRGICFLQKENEEFGEIVYIQRMVESGGDVYFFAVEVIRFLSNGTVSFHLQAPYGKLRDGRMLLLCIDPLDPARRWAPIFLTGGSEPPVSLRLGPSLHELNRLSISVSPEDRFGMDDLFRVRMLGESYGNAEHEAFMALFGRLLLPFGLLVSGMLSVALGQRAAFRRDRSIPAAFYWVVPLVPVPVAFLVFAGLYVQKALIGVALVLLGILPAILVFLTLQLTLILISLGACATQLLGPFDKVS